MCRSYIYAMLLLICTSCASQKVVTNTDVQKDSVSVVVVESIVYRDTTIYVEVPVEVIKEILPDTDTSHLETSIAVSEAWVNAGKLNHTLSHKPNASIQQIIPVPEKHTQKDSVVISIKEVVKEVPVEVEKELNKWQTFRMMLGTLTLIAIGVWLLLKILKRVLVK